MRKLKVCFCSKTGEAVNEEIINAESYEDAFQKFIVGKEPNDFQTVIVDVAGFFGSISSIAQAFSNPLCRIKKSQINNDESINPKFIDYEAGSSDLDLDLLNSGNIDTNSEIKSAGRKQYKVMTQKDKWFSQKFDPERLEQALNAYAREGWVVKSVCTASIAGFGGNREELIVIFER